MIYTLTTNPSIDYYIYQQKPICDGINRPESCEFVAAGKGVNVSRMLARLSTPSKCVMIVGGFTGKYICEEVKKEQLIEVAALEVQQPSRVNVKVRHGEHEELDLNAPGPVVDKQTGKQLVKAFEGVKAGDYVLINGTVQNEIIDSIIEIARKVASNGAKLILDVPNLTLEQILKCQPYLIKPNEEELQKLLQSSLTYPEIIPLTKEKLCSKGIAVMLSLGSQGSAFITAQESYQLTITKLNPVNTVAAGDSLLAGFLYQLTQNKPVEEILRFASAAGSAAVMSTYLPEESDIEKYLDDIKITKL